METELSFFVAANSSMEIMSALDGVVLWGEQLFFEIFFKMLKKPLVKVLLDKASFET